MRDGHPAEKTRPASTFRGSYASPAGLTASEADMQRLRELIKSLIKPIVIEHVPILPVSRQHHRENTVRDLRIGGIVRSVFQVFVVVIDLPD